MHIGLLAAMPEELGQILNSIKVTETKKFGDLELFSGIWTNQKGKEILLTIAWSGWGKVSAARASTRLISNIFKNCKVDFVIFTGVAGAVNEKLKQWDIILSEAVIQHDMDASPLFDKFVIPALGYSQIKNKKNIIDNFYKILNKRETVPELSIFSSLHKGLVGTGDVFISEKEKLNQLSKEIPNLLAVEMEGAAFAQVAHQENIDWIVIRVISDGADDNAGEEFNEFLKKYKLKSWELIKFILNAL